jgi:hypothetical protein
MKNLCTIALLALASFLYGQAEGAAPEAADTAEVPVTASAASLEAVPERAPENEALHPVVSAIIEKKFCEDIRPYGSDRYIGTLFVEDSKLKISFNACGDLYPTIMAYDISGDTIKLITKNRDVYNQKNPRAHYGELYWSIELYLEDGEVKYKCYWIEDPYMIIKGYTFTEGTINEKFVKIRTEPNTKSHIYGTLNIKSKIKVTSIGSKWTRVVKMGDFWVEVEINGGKFWVYGYYVDFATGIKLKII